MAGLASAAVDETVLISRASGAGGAGGDGASLQPATSANGRYVAFVSSATNLSPEGSGRRIYLRDTVANTTTLVSRQTGTGPGGAPNSDSFAPAISADGRYVAFESKADNLSDDDVGGTWDIYVRDTVSNTTTLASRQTGTASGNGGDASSFASSISADGRYVAFDSKAT